jgi:hypothetical protein
MEAKRKQSESWSKISRKTSTTQIMKKAKTTKSNQQTPTNRTMPELMAPQKKSETEAECTHVQNIVKRAAASQQQPKPKLGSGGNTLVSPQEGQVNKPAISAQRPLADDVPSSQTISDAFSVLEENDCVHPVSSQKATTLMEEFESYRFEEYEHSVSDGLVSMFAAKLALLEIRNQGLYRLSGYESFEDYCREQWVLAPSTVEDMIGFAITHLYLTDAEKDPQPVEDCHYRALSGLSLRQKSLVWDEALRPAYKGHPSDHQLIEARNRLGFEAPSSSPNTKG